MASRTGPVAPGIAFITGGARGLGNAIAVSFSKEGAKGVCLVDILDEATFEEGKKVVEKYGAKVRKIWTPSRLPRRVLNFGPWARCSRSSSWYHVLKPGLIYNFNPTYSVSASAPM